MTAPAPYLLLPGTARDALTFYRDVFGGDLRLHTFADLGRDDGPADAIGHGVLTEGPVELFAADAVGDEPALRTQGLMLTLLGTTSPDGLHEWFAALGEGGRVVDELQVRPWGDADGQVVDRFGVHWLLGYHGSQA